MSTVATDTPLLVHAVMNGEKIETKDRVPRENPSNPDEIVGYTPHNTREDAIRAIDAAADAFPKWAATPLEERIACMRRAHETFMKMIPELSRLLSREHGKPLYDATGELHITGAWMDYGCDKVQDAIKDKIHSDEKGRVILTHDPVGVVSAISPWNYPIILAMIKVVPGLLTGNTMVLKPSPFAPLTITRVIEMLAEEFPPGVINIVHGGADVGVELTTNPKVAKIAFTGGTKTARQIMKAAADTIKKLTLELGGNDPAIILEDFNVDDDRAIRRMVISNFLTSGQICMVAKRVYVHRSLYDRFVERYVEAARKWVRVGNPLNPEVTVGPVNNPGQKKFVQELVDDARKRGCEIKTLGQIKDQELFEKGYFMQPTLVLGAGYHDPIVVEEQFGPTVPIMPYDSEEEVIHLANDSIYGLTSSVWGDEEHAIRVARRIQAGVTMINTGGLQGLDIRFPFGGVKQSGIGREFGPEAFLSYVEQHVITVPKEKDLPHIPE